MKTIIIFIILCYMASASIFNNTNIPLENQISTNSSETQVDSSTRNLQITPIVDSNTVNITKVSSIFNSQDPNNPEKGAKAISCQGNIFQNFLDKFNLTYIFLYFLIFVFGGICLFSSIFTCCICFPYFQCACWTGIIGNFMKICCCWKCHREKNNEEGKQNQQPKQQFHYYHEVHNHEVQNKPPQVQPNLPQAQPKAPQFAKQ